MYDRIFGDFPAKNTVYTLYMVPTNPMYITNSYGLCRVGQNRIYTPYMTVYLVVSLPKYRIHTVYIRFWPNLVIKGGAGGDGGCGGASGGCRSILPTKGYK